ncbi:transposase [Streptomyces sp. NPDC002730]|uniref:transposase n=1 Tax=Streptomyces sp. NPDC002730 TaxID=3364662 RepID=UPI0036CF8F29
MTAVVSPPLGTWPPTRALRPPPADPAHPSSGHRSCSAGTTSTATSARKIKEWAAANSTWLTIFQLPSYAPELNPAEGIWSLIKRGVLANLAATSVDHLVKVAKHGLKLIQYRPHLVDGCLAETGLTTTTTLT